MFFGLLNEEKLVIFIRGKNYSILTNEENIIVYWEEIKENIVFSTQSHCR